MFNVLYHIMHVICVVYLTWPNGESNYATTCKEAMSPKPLWPIGLIDVHQQKQVLYFQSSSRSNLVVFIVISTIMYDRASQVSAKTWSSLNFGLRTPNTTTQDTPNPFLRHFVHCLCPLLRNSLSKPQASYCFIRYMSYDHQRSN